MKNTASNKGVTKIEKGAQLRPFFQVLSPIFLSSQEKNSELGIPHSQKSLGNPPAF